MDYNRERARKHKPNTALYVKMMFGSFAILLLLFIIPQTSAWFAIISGIGSGCVASVIVAWLIDTSTCKRYNERDVEIRRHYYGDLEASLFDLFLVFAALSYEKLPQYQKEQEYKRKWFEWIGDMQVAYGVEYNTEEKYMIVSKFLAVFGCIDKIQDKRIEITVENVLSHWDFSDLQSLRRTLDDFERAVCLDTIDRYRLPIAIGRLKQYLKEDEYLNGLNDLVLTFGKE